MRLKLLNKRKMDKVKFVRIFVCLRLKGCLMVFLCYILKFLRMFIVMYIVVLFVLKKIRCDKVVVVRDFLDLKKMYVVMVRWYMV